MLKFRMYTKQVLYLKIDNIVGFEQAVELSRVLISNGVYPIERITLDHSIEECMEIYNGLQKSKI